jgi:hypothetical protein
MIKNISEEQVTRIDDAIKLMEWVDGNTNGKFNMKTWQSGLIGINDASKTLDEIVSCGSVCCFGGYLAVSDKFIEAGGSADGSNGAPIFDGYGNANAVSEYLGISVHDAQLLTCYDAGYSLASDTYGCSISEVTPKDVIKQLKVLKFKYTT